MSSFPFGSDPIVDSGVASSSSGSSGGRSSYFWLAVAVGAIGVVGTAAYFLGNTKISRPRGKGVATKARKSAGKATLSWEYLLKLEPRQLAEVAEQAQKQQDEVLLCRVQYLLGSMFTNVALSTGNVELLSQARACLTGARDIAEAKDLSILGPLEIQLGQFYHFLGQDEQVIALLQSGIKRMESVSEDDPDFFTLTDPLDALFLLGKSASLSKRYNLVIDSLERFLTGIEEREAREGKSEHPQVLLQCFCLLAMSHTALKDKAGFKRYAQKILEALRDLDASNEQHRAIVRPLIDELSVAGELSNSPSNQDYELTVSLVDRALELLSTEQDASARLQLGFPKLEALLEMKRWEEAELLGAELLKQVVELADINDNKWSIFMKMANIYSEMGYKERALSTLEQGDSLLQKLDDALSASASSASASLTQSMFFQQRLVALVQSLLNYNRGKLLSLMGRLGEAKHYLKKACEGQARYGPNLLSCTEAALASTLLQAGEMEEGLKMMQRLEAALKEKEQEEKKQRKEEEEEDEEVDTDQLHELGESHFYLGNFSIAINYLSRACNALKKQSKEGKGRRNGVSSLVRWAAACFLSGDFAQASQLLSEAQSIADESPSQAITQRGSVAVVRGQYYLCAGEIELASKPLASATKCLDPSNWGASPIGLPNVFASFAALYLWQDEEEQALHYCFKMLQRVTEDSKTTTTTRTKTAAEEEGSNVLSNAFMIHAVASVFFHLGYVEEAAKLLEASISLLREKQAPNRTLLEALLLLAAAKATLSSPGVDELLDEIKRVQEELSSSHELDKRTTMLTLYFTAVALIRSRKNNNVEDAVVMLKEAAELANTIGDKLARALVLREQVLLNDEKEEDKEEYMRIAEITGNRFLLRIGVVETSLKTLPANEQEIVEKLISLKSAEEKREEVQEEEKEKEKEKEEEEEEKAEEEVQLPKIEEVKEDEQPEETTKVEVQQQQEEKHEETVTEEPKEETITPAEPVVAEQQQEPEQERENEEEAASEQKEQTAVEPIEEKTEEEAAVEEKNEKEEEKVEQEQPEEQEETEPVEEEEAAADEEVKEEIKDDETELREDDEVADEEDQGRDDDEERVVVDVEEQEQAEEENKPEGENVEEEEEH